MKSHRNAEQIMEEKERSSRTEPKTNKVAVDWQTVKHEFNYDGTSWELCACKAISKPMGVNSWAFVIWLRLHDYKLSSFVSPINRFMSTETRWDFSFGPQTGIEIAFFLKEGNRLRWRRIILLHGNTQFIMLYYLNGFFKTSVVIAKGWSRHMHVLMRPTFVLSRSFVVYDVLVNEALIKCRETIVKLSSS